MSRIDPARLSRILASLAKPKGQVSESSQSSAELPTAAARQSRKSTSVLRANLRQRLLKLRSSHEDFQVAAPIVAVQEILRWEFGGEIVEHAEFDRVIDAITQTMLADDKTKATLSRLIETLSADQPD